MIAIAGGKGGCGKTTTALGVARALARRDARPRVVDLDVGMPNLHRLAGVEREPTLAAVRSDPIAAQVDDAGVAVVPAPRATSGVDVADALADLPPARGATLLDCPAGAGPVAAAPLRVADATLLVATDRRESLEDAAKTGRVADTVGTPVLGAVVTRSRDAVPRAERALPTGQMVGIPETPEPLADATARERYATVAGWVRGWRQRGPDDEERRTPCRGSEAKTASAEADDLRRPRDRRSRRARAGGGARSSSRGGGGPSGRR